MVPKAQATEAKVEKCGNSQPNKAASAGRRKAHSLSRDTTDVKVLLDLTLGEVLASEYMGN